MAPTTTASSPQQQQRTSVENKVYKYILTVQSAIIAETMTFPLDITKTRLQLQHELLPRGTAVAYKGMFGTGLEIVTKEGFTGLYQGLPPALLRHVVYSGIRIGIYEHIRDALKGNADEFPLWKKCIAGASAGAIGQLIASPTDLVKVRLQSQRRQILQATLSAAMGSAATSSVAPARLYKGTWDAFSTIAREEGVRGMWKGVGPNVQRAALVNLGELATYDQSKEFLLKANLGDNLATQTIAGIMSGIFAALFSTPADVVKTRMMSQYMSSTSEKLYSSSFDCLRKTINAEGLFGLYKGFFPTWARLGPWQLTFWIVYEQLRSVSGIGTF